MNVFVENLFRFLLPMFFSSNCRSVQCVCTRPQERISSLLITMLGLATMKSPPGSDEAEDREGDRDLSAFFPGFSQIASSSSSSHSLQSSQSSQSQFMAMNDSSSSSAAQRLSLSPESAMACKTLWGVVNTTVELHTTDFGVYSAELSDTDPYNAVEAGKAELLMQLCHACLVTATRLPEKFGSVRVSAAQRIIAIVKLRDRLQTAATVSVFQAKLRLRDAKKDKGKKKVRTAELGEGEDADEDDGLGKERETDVAAPGLGGSVSAGKYTYPHWVGPCLQVHWKKEGACNPINRLCVLIRYLISFYYFEFLF